MRGVDWTAIKAASAAIRPAASTSVLRGIPPFWPTPDNETVFASSEYVTRSQEGNFVKLPMLLGNCDNENSYYQIPAYGNGVVPTAAQVTSFLLESFTCPVAFQAANREKNGAPAWVYRYFADWDNTRLFSTSGAYHGVDLQMIFGASEDVSGLPTTADQRKLTKVMQDAWFAFVNDPTHGLEHYGWPQYDPNGKTLIELGLDNNPRPQFAYPSTSTAPCSNATFGALGIIGAVVASAVGNLTGS
jgi:carboxylesterase type B